MTSTSSKRPTPRHSESPVLPAFELMVALVVSLALVVGTMLVVNSRQSPSRLVRASLAQWSVTANSTAPAGRVTFEVTNNGTMVHEMIVMRTDIPADELPVTDAGEPPAPVATGADKVGEGDNVGETGAPDLEAGATRTFVIDNMEPGKYVLFCNLAGHYQLGMRTGLSVMP